MALNIDRSLQVGALGEAASRLTHGPDRRGQPPDF
jgi:hypothetical protein